MIERIIIFLIMGLFVFSPEIQSFWSTDPVAWYRNHVAWLIVIGLSYLASRTRRLRRD
ncbi:MAG: hypothetical protein KDI19_00405 [Pseudomonadales bacterium]|nr:hypothetical protein [Pseudomonadales bacterium]